MTHISRPFQIALAALVLFVAVWFVALRGHSSGGESSSSSSSPAAPSSSPSGSSPGGGSAASQGKTYTGSVPGVAGLSRAIARAQGAVKQSQQNAQQLQQQSQQASGAGQASSKSQSQSQSRAQGQSQSQGGASSATHSASAPADRGATHAAAPKATSHAKAPAAKSKSTAASMQARVEAELKQGKIVAVLFWNPKGTVDGVVRRELQVARRALGGRLAVHVARSSQVGSFGSFTRTVRVYATPTILLINPQGKTSSSAGLIDTFGIEQAVKEIKHVK